MHKYRFVLTVLAAALTACGGGGSAGVTAGTPAPTEATLGGTVSGVPAGVTVLLKNGDAETLAVTGGGAFAFSKKVAAGASYNVTLVTQPSGYTCSLASGSGTATQGTTSISTIAVTCQVAVLAMSNFNVGVTVSGLASGQSVTFANGASTLVVSGNGLYLFADSYVKQAVYAGTLGGYDVTVKTPPTGQTCTLTGASGALKLGDPANFVNVQAACK
ncbi:hypothetical protein GTP56_23505 [Duganella sp. FT134W]|uniref:Carboxypeptidase regulatory-like domain-containing protein n=1 Tax=Duganella margarita TaxID=2692170 RepID=A0A7X4KI25_9BURK|nr:hypothetical protein [Duganella margarita]MYM75141.1 hypothetical protein [Duganella margarita]